MKEGLYYTRYQIYSIIKSDPFFKKKKSLSHSTFNINNKLSSEFLTYDFLYRVHYLDY